MAAMFSAGTVLAATGVYLLMVAAFFWARWRRFHVPVMIGAMVFDFTMPFYLYLTKDWYRRLVVEGELTSFLLWTHLLLVLTLYMLYAMQIQSARHMLRGELTLRADHGAQGRAILLVRAFVIFTGALMVEVPQA
ncbi:MAG: hypothetical protein Q8L89_05360 [Gammaproteobacteria bacterium]|nr:hypothetical protein [Gammaproteobacteria bacterium]